VLELNVYDPKGTKASWARNIVPDGQFLAAMPPKGSSLASGTWLFAVYYDRGYSVVLPDGRRERPAPGTKGIRVQKFGKALFAAGKAGGDFGRVVGHRLEIVPKADPFAVQPGQTLQVAVRWEGKPLSGAELFFHDAVTTPFNEATVPRYKSDTQGVVMVPISKRGLYVLVVDHATAPANPDLATEDEYSATLSFVVP
jgi:uncharacterized GH25 family protein